MPNKAFYQVSLKAFFRDSKGRILAMKCVPASSKAGYYELPGGRIDEGEFQVPFADILERELVEELGAEVQFAIKPTPVALGRHLLATKQVYVLLVFFEVEHFAGDVQISEEHEGFTWIDLDAVNLEDFFVSGDLEGVRMYWDRYGNDDH